MILNTDGGARGNPGPGAGGAVLFSANGEIIKTQGKYFGRCTNNEAEYKALLMGLVLAVKEDVKDLTCKLDSELIVKQLNGQYKVKNVNLKLHFDKVIELKPYFTRLEFVHVPRKDNKEADKIVNQVLDEHASKKN